MIIRHCGKGGRCSYAPRVPAACPKPALSKPQSSNAKAISHASPLKEALRRWRKIEEARQGNVAMTTERRGEYRWLVLFAFSLNSGFNSFMFMDFATTGCSLPLS